MGNTMEWQLVRFNPRRNARNVAAAEVRVDGECLWMTVRDIKNNIRDFGDHPELQKALQAYKANVEYPVSETHAVLVVEPFRLPKANETDPFPCKPVIRQPMLEAKNREHG